MSMALASGIWRFVSADLLVLPVVSSFPADGGYESCRNFPEGLRESGPPQQRVGGFRLPSTAGGQCLAKSKTRLVSLVARFFSTKTRNTRTRKLSEIVATLQLARRRAFWKRCSRRSRSFTVALAGMLAVVVALSTLHLCVLIAQEIWTPPRFLLRVPGLLEIFGYFLLVLIGVRRTSFTCALS